jgi:hypothetical protein
MTKLTLSSIVVAFTLALPFGGSADPSQPTVEVACGGTFQPQVNPVSGSSSQTLFRLQGVNGHPALVPTNPAHRRQSLLLQTFCPSGDAALTAQCEAAALQDAINDAVAECRRAAIAKGSDPSLYRCKRESCPPGSIGCEVMATNTDCRVLVPKLQCRCNVQPFLEQPWSPVSTYACGCNCTCTASGGADMQCTNCDGSCAQTSGHSGGEDGPAEDPLTTMFSLEDVF